MKSFLATLVLSLFAVAPALAQPPNTVWFIGIGGGLGAHDNGPFSRRLASYTPARSNGESLLYQSQNFSNTGYTLNAGGGVLFGGNFLIGLNGEKLFFPTMLVTTSIDNKQ